MSSSRIHDHGMPNPSQNLTAIVLSGGGAKGSFEVGALFYMREIWSSIQPRIVCGTSVGAINGVAVAESDDGAGIGKLETIWLGLQYNSDMYTLSPEFEQVFSHLGINVADVVLHGGGLPFSGISGFLSFVATLGLSPETAGWVAIGWAAGGPVGGLIAGIVQLGSSSKDKLEDAIKNLSTAAFAYDLSPLQALIERNVDPKSVASSGMQLRLAVVALEDGNLYYVTESGDLLRDRAANANFHEAITNEQVLPPPVGPVDPAGVIYPGLIRNPLVAGMMASAAFPGIFQIRPLFTQSSLQYYMDGGTAGLAHPGGRGIGSTAHFFSRRFSDGSWQFRWESRRNSRNALTNRQSRHQPARRRTRNCDRGTPGRFQRPGTTNLDPAIFRSPRHDADRSGADTHQHGVRLLSSV
jgi:Patatin-like phospholipase